ncbi:MAG: hypothetical protein J0M15_13080 [Deltaproteobacteria bacterium]|nr:hypothetical protein [Deltaproteobacteria bacterium]
MKKNLFILTFLLTAPFAAKADSLEFTLNTTDGLSHIHGQVDIPQCGKAPFPVVLMVAGTGLFTRNTYFGRSHTDRDLLFADLSQKLNQDCVATVRFDSRGVLCDLMSKAVIAKCVDQSIRGQVTEQTNLDDIQVVYDFAANLGLLDKSKLIFLGHSEGTLYISRLIARKSVETKAIMFIGGITESAQSILHWQISDRMAAWTMAMDSNQDGILTNEEIKAGLGTSRLNGSFPLEVLLSPKGSWTSAEVTASFEENYKAAIIDAQSHKPSDPYMQNGVVFSAYKWWQSWFTNNTSVLENLKNFVGPIEYHNGDIDTQTPGLREREKAIHQASSLKMKSWPSFVIHQGKGHGLSKDPLYGPIDEDIAASIVTQIGSWCD